MDLLIKVAFRWTWLRLQPRPHFQWPLNTACSWYQISSTRYASGVYSDWSRRAKPACRSHQPLYEVSLITRFLVHQNLDRMRKVFCLVHLAFSTKSEHYRLCAPGAASHRTQYPVPNTAGRVYPAVNALTFNNLMLDYEICRLKLYGLHVRQVGDSPSPK